MDDPGRDKAVETFTCPVIRLTLLGYRWEVTGQLAGDSGSIKNMFYQG